MRIVMTGEELRAARKQRGMSTQYLADLLGVHRNTIGRWESGWPIPGPAQLSLDWILRESARPAGSPPPKRRRTRPAA